MNLIMTVVDKPEIGIVLKALNHPLRRDLLIYLNERKVAKFTDLYQQVIEETKSTGQFSYHLNMLLDAQILEKTDDNYRLSTIGEKATAMIQLIDIEVDNTISQKITASFSQLSPRELVVISWIILPVVFFSLSMSGQLAITFTPFQRILFNIVTTGVFVITMVYTYNRLQYLPSLLALSNIIWILFLRKDHFVFFGIYLTAGIGGALFLTGVFVNANLVSSIIGGILLITGIGLSIWYLVRENNRIIEIKIN